MVKQLVAIIFIYLCTAAAWGILGSTVLNRTYSSDRSNGEKLDQLWGTAQNQAAPSVCYETKKQVLNTTIKDDKKVTETVTETISHLVPIGQSKVTANLHLQYRQKGLLWYSTYKVHFQGVYKITNATGEKQKFNVELPLPSEQAIYDDLKVVIGDQTLANTQTTGNAIHPSFDLAPGATVPISFSYDSQGQDNWRYSFGITVNQVKDFTLKMTTDFDSIDFPQNSMSPTDKKKLANGWELTWHYNNLLTGYTVGMAMPTKLNPGPWVSKVTFFAPVSLFLFFFLLFMFTTIKGIRVHPMNYFFIGAAFFSFHLLLAYLVDHMSVDAAFGISAVVSVFLVISYMRLVVSNKFAFVEVGISQLIYLVLFSYTFFFEQYTGLVITVMCVLTLFIMMQFTGKIDWDQSFQKAMARRRPDGKGVAVAQAADSATSSLPPDWIRFKLTQDR